MSGASFVSDWIIDLGNSNYIILRNLVLNSITSRCKVTCYKSYCLLLTESLLDPGGLGGSDSKESPCNAGDLGLITVLGRSSEEGNGYPLQGSCLENPEDREPWQATVHRVTKCRT